MPIYEYLCLKCKKEHEIMQKFSDAPLSVCPECGGKMKKMISNTSFVLKGSGWYATDYASKGKKEDKKDEKKDTKPEAKTESAKSKDSRKKSEPVPA